MSRGSAHVVHPSSTESVLSHALIPAVLLLLLPTTVVGAAGTLSLRFEDRVACQDAIGRVYYEHRIGDTRPFPQAMPREVLETKVRRTLAQSFALQRYWATAITAEMLHAELERIAEGSLFPDRLAAIYDALERDPLLLQECLARPGLVDRLSRSFLARDDRFQAPAREEAAGLRDGLVSGELDPWAEHPNRVVIELGRLGAREADRDPSRPEAGVEPVLLDPMAFDAERRKAPSDIGVVGDILQEPGRFSIRVVLDEEDDRARVAVYSVAKTTWESWWADTAAGFEAPSPPVPAPVGGIPRPSGRRLAASDSLDALWRAARESSSATCDPIDRWDNGGLDDIPAAWEGHTAVWTGTRMIVWGGAEFPTGGSYDPLTDTWSGVSRVGSPSGRRDHTAVWTGARMIIWGGTVAGASVDTGGVYDPLSDTWEPTSTASAPLARRGHTAIWTGSEMIVWGGERLDSGGRYDPAADTWTSTSLTGAPTGRSSHTAVWTGSRMVIWGGRDVGEENTGGRYDPSTDTWEPTSLAGAPTARRDHSAVWTGTEMIVWGGQRPTSFLCFFDSGDFTEIFYDEALGEAAAYDPVQDAWRPLPGGPRGRSGHAAVWDGERMIVTGGSYMDAVLVSSPCSYFFMQVGLVSGGLLDPQSGVWASTSTINAPYTFDLPAVWSGDLMLIWGAGNATSAAGSRYDPAADVWTPMSIGDAPSRRSGHTTVWTGNEMIVWGGGRQSTGGRYDPVLDAWTPTSVVGVPEGRDRHTAVWTGQEMIVFGGAGSSGPYLNTGGRYDPMADDWTATVTFGAPAKAAHTAVWTGEEMIVWGGLSQTGCCDARYDPVADNWAPVSMTDAPSQRSGHSAVWTGSEMLVWGGSDPLGAGGRYSPSSDTWSPIATTSEPSPRTDHTAVWTGSHMVVWGGEATAGPTVALDTGGLYDPTTDTWMSTPTTDAPSPRLFHTAVWDGRRMLVWGGADARTGGSVLDTGGRFDPTTGTWVATVVEGAPVARVGHGAIAADGEMIVWGGAFPRLLRDGGRYVALAVGDPCGTGIGLCETSGTVVCPGDGLGAACDAVAGEPAAEECDGLDNDCDGMVDDGDPGSGEPCGVSDVGECHLGATTCQDGTLLCSGNVDPVAEICGDGLDNDCDGSVDELTPIATCTLLPSTLNVRSQAGSFQIGLRDLVDSCDPASPVPLDASSISIAWISRAGNVQLEDPFAQDCPDPSVGVLFERGIVENLDDRQVIGGELRLKFNLEADGNCQTLDGGRQELIGLLTSVVDGEEVPVCVTSSISGARFECCGSALVRNTGNR